jgi:electron transport complex protein RnfD
VPWWIVASGIGAALLFGKHVYGGLGRNPFNPAMLGVALVLLGFPAALAAHAVDSGSGNSDGWIWIAGADALGGLILLRLRIVRWQIPLAVFAGAAVGAGALWLGDGAIGLRGLLAGNLVLGAFFIASDPVSGCITRRGRWIFGAGVGLSIALLNRYATTAASLPIAMLLMNCAAPWIDRRTQPRRLAEQQHG